MSNESIEFSNSSVTFPALYYELLDEKDQSLFRRCKNNCIEFLWPESNSGRSVDEQSCQKQKRHNIVEKNLKTRRNSTYRNKKESEKNKHIGKNSLQIISNNIFVGEDYSGKRILANGIPSNQCHFCGALRWPSETDGIYCNNGKIKIALSLESTPVLNYFWETDNFDGITFRKYSRYLNNALSMASQCVKELKPPGRRGWTPNIVIQGKVNRFIGSLLPNGNKTPKFSQIWVHDPQDPQQQSAVRFGNIPFPESITENEKKQ